jgi:hypothetical protein
MEIESIPEGRVKGVCKGVVPILDIYLMGTTRHVSNDEVVIETRLSPTVTNM